jgi:hypothetical protein
MRVVAVAHRPLDATLVVYDPRGERVVTPERRGASPYWWVVELTPQAAGAYRAGLGDGGTVAACDTIEVGTAPRGARGGGGAWPIARTWNRATEDLFSVWVEKLFDDPLDAQPSWKSLDELTGSSSRNLLHDHLGLDEDSARSFRMTPDCADLPYFLRAYFAWKMRLPFGFSSCSRGGGGRPPSCGTFRSSANVAGGGDEVGRVRQYIGDVGAGVNSGAGRTRAQDDRTDFYPVKLSTDTLRPGTVYGDPYGHMLIIVRRIPQTATSGGILLAADAQPDTTVARKRYWRGNFLFALDPTLGSAGFKRFRPIVARGGALRPLSNGEIARDPEYGDFALDQYEHGVDGFYERVDEVLSPDPVDPVRSFRETIDALDEQIRTRVKSVANGEEYVASNPGTIAMPTGAAIFETSGAWEDYATPSRDLRMLIAIDAVRDFPARVLRHPDRFTIPSGRSGADVRRELEDTLRTEAERRSFEYVRSNGAPWSLTVADVIERAPALEVAYNPNDCAEIRWGAPPDSDERATCRRHAPPDQQALMREYRDWFHDRRRPPR